MADVTFTFFLTNLILIVGLVEYYCRMFYNTNYHFSRVTNFPNKINIPALSYLSNTIFYAVIMQGLALTSFKIVQIVSIPNILPFNIFYMYIGLIILNIFYFNLAQLHKNIVYTILLWLGFIIQLFYVVTNFLTFILILECIATLYYFFFLNNFVDNNQTLIKLKNLLSNYLWLSFFTLLFFCFSLIFIVISIGSLEFVELNLLHKYMSSPTMLLLLVGIFWKLGLPGFHFFKLEIYQYLSLSTIIYFSIFTLLLNSYILIFLASNLTFLFTANINYFIILILISNIIIMLRGLEALKLFQFLALSGINAITTIVVFILL